jgi:nucleotide-binding universal stress UspA family protein
MAIEPIAPVVVGVDGSLESMRALDLAAEEALSRVTPLVVVHVQRSNAPAEARLTGRRLLAIAASRVGSEHPPLGVSTELVTGYAGDAIVARSHDACLVVVGRRRAGRTGPPIASVALNVAARAACPVLVHRPLTAGRSAAGPRPVLLGVDGRDPAESAIEFAFMEAELRGASLLAVYVRPERDGMETTRHRQMLHEAIAGWADKYPEVTVSEQVGSGADVAEALAEASRNAQLAAVGASEPGLSRIVLGSVSQTMVQLAGCPVAVVPPG